MITPSASAPDMRAVAASYSELINRSNSARFAC
jgi:hypothetical protein